MRLSAEERRAIDSAAREAFPAGTRVLLFGSRVNDDRRGGDIDLLIEPPEPLAPDDLVARRSCFVARLYRLIDEQRIDVVVAGGAEDESRPIVRAARAQGLEVSRT